jgi:putative tricarboxylic transport membrane protein
MSITDERPKGTVADTVPSGRAATGPLVLGAVVLLAGLGLLAQAIGDAAEHGVTVDGPRLAPLIVTGGWVGLATAYLLQVWKAKPAAESEEGAARASWFVPAALMAALVGYALVLEYTVVGYVPTTAVFFVVAARLLSSRPVREVILRDVVVGLGLSLVIYLAFTRLLDIQLPAGVLPI